MKSDIWAYIMADLAVSNNAWCSRLLWAAIRLKQLFLTIASTHPNGLCIVTIPRSKANDIHNFLVAVFTDATVIVHDPFSMPFFFSHHPIVNCLIDYLFHITLIAIMSN